MLRLGTLSFKPGPSSHILWECKSKSLEAMVNRLSGCTWTDPAGRENKTTRQRWNALWQSPAEAGVQRCSCMPAGQEGAWLFCTDSLLAIPAATTQPNTVTTWLRTSKESWTIFVENTNTWGSVSKGLGWTSRSNKAARVIEAWCSSDRCQKCLMKLVGVIPYPQIQQPRQKAHFQKSQPPTSSSVLKLCLLLDK